MEAGSIPKWDSNSKSGSVAYFARVLVLAHQKSGHRAESNSCCVAVGPSLIPVVFAKRICAGKPKPLYLGLDPVATLTQQGLAIRFGTTTTVDRIDLAEDVAELSCVLGPPG